jgi:hypothetical protein
MKKIIMPMAVAIAAVSFASCNGSNSADTRSDSSSTTTTESSSTNAAGTPAVQVHYVDLSTGSDVTVEKDAETGVYMNTETHKPIDFYFDPGTSDTFDTRGRIVNMAIIRDNTGNYTIDESKVKIQGDGDLKIKEGDSKIKLDADGDTKVKTDDFKEKTKGDDYKYKDDSTTIKVKDNKVKIKKT